MPKVLFPITPGVATVGVDEVGRGALAGPVVAAACVLPELRRYPVRITDSKLIEPEEREKSFQWLTEHCVFGVGSVPAFEIDRLGIVAATEIAMQQAVLEISRIHSELYILVDGRDGFWFDHPHSSIVGGDLKEKCIGAASIIAKVTRDRWMMDIDHHFPEYGFAKHKGYGTKEHYDALDTCGKCAIHRESYLSFDSEVLAVTVSSSL